MSSAKKGGGLGNRALLGDDGLERRGLNHGENAQLRGDWSQRDQSVVILDQHRGRRNRRSAKRRVLIRVSGRRTARLDIVEGGKGRRLVEQLVGQVTAV